MVLKETFLINIHLFHFSSFLCKVFLHASMALYDSFEIEFFPLSIQINCVFFFCLKFVFFFIKNLSVAKSIHAHNSNEKLPPCAGIQMNVCVYCVCLFMCTLCRINYKTLASSQVLI